MSDFLFSIIFHFDFFEYPTVDRVERSWNSFRRSSPHFLRASHILLNYEGTGILTDFSSAVPRTLCESGHFRIQRIPLEVPENRGSMLSCASWNKGTWWNMFLFFSTLGRFGSDFFSAGRFQSWQLRWIFLRLPASGHPFRATQTLPRRSRRESTMGWWMFSELEQLVLSERDL